MGWLDVCFNLDLMNILRTTHNLKNDIVDIRTHIISFIAHIHSQSSIVPCFVGNSFCQLEHLKTPYPYS